MWQGVLAEFLEGRLEWVSGAECVESTEARESTEPTRGRDVDSGSANLTTRTPSDGPFPNPSHSNVQRSPKLDSQRSPSSRSGSESESDSPNLNVTFDDRLCEVPGCGAERADTVPAGYC